MAEVKDIAIYGAGGFGKEVACLIKRINEIEQIWNLVGFFDDDEALKGRGNGYGEILGVWKSLMNGQVPCLLLSR